MDNVIQYFNNTVSSSLKFSKCISVSQYFSFSVFQRCVSIKSEECQPTSRQSPKVNRRVDCFN